MPAEILSSNAFIDAGDGDAPDEDLEAAIDGAEPAELDELERFPDPKSMNTLDEVWPSPWWGDNAAQDRVKAITDEQTTDAEQRILNTELDYVAAVDEAQSNGVLLATTSDHQIVYVKAMGAQDAYLVAEYTEHDMAHQPLAEAGAWQVAKIMGEPYSRDVAPTVLVEIDGKHPASVSAMAEGYPQTRSWKDQDLATVRTAFVFDLVIGNTDRHNGNALQRNDGSFSLIDHGLAFLPAGNSRAGHNTLVDREDVANDPAAGLQPHEREALERVCEQEEKLERMLGHERAHRVLGRAEYLLQRGQLIHFDELISASLWP